MAINLDYKRGVYNTPKYCRRYLGDALSFHSRWYYHLRTYYAVWKTSRAAKKKVNFNEEWIKHTSTMFKNVEGCGSKIHLRGLENLVNDSEPVIFIGNHMSTLETFMLPAILCPVKETSFIVKQSLAKLPVFRWIMKTSQAIVVSRVDPINDYKTVMKEGKKIIESGRSICVFPQSTRNVEFKPEEFGSIGIKLAAKTGAKVIPIALKTDFWGVGKHLKEFGPLNRDEEVFFEFGEPIEVNGNGKVEHLQVISFIESRLEAWNDKETYRVKEPRFVFNKKLALRLVNVSCLFLFCFYLFTHFKPVVL